jgi:NADPH:quinone reductase-like Zn-dependent oxidoreductase
VNYPDELMFLKNRKAQQTFSHASLHGKTIVLTGATSGIGLRTAHALAAGGANLVLVARNPKLALQVQSDLISAYGINVKAIQADFADLNEVHRAADQILQVSERIDGLINCAGMHSTKLTFTKAGLETVFCVNHLAAFTLTCRLLPRLKASIPARILDINSEGHRFSGVNLDDLDWRTPPLHGSARVRRLQKCTAFDDVGTQRSFSGQWCDHQCHASGGRAIQHWSKQWLVVSGFLEVLHPTDVEGC